jgi:hypothetical protein
VVELQAILKGTFPCGTHPCIDPVFGPTFAYYYWSATTYATLPNNAWVVSFDVGKLDNSGFKGFVAYVRAVRTSL